MTVVSADLLYPKLEAVTPEASVRCSELLDDCAQLGCIADELGLHGEWAEVNVGGSDDAVGTRIGPQADVVGVSPRRALAFGIGFWREEQLPRAPEGSQSASDVSASPLRRRVVERARASFSERTTRIETLESVLRAAGPRLARQFEHVEVEGTIRYAFHVGYRRFLAYRIAYRASLERGTLEPYTSHLERLVSGSPEDVEGSCAGLDDEQVFSVVLNLIGYLDRAHAWERAHGAPHSSMPGKLRGPVRKREILQGLLARASAELSPRLNDDGRFALRGVLRELEADARHGVHAGLRLPVWGARGTSEDFE